MFECREAEQYHNHGEHRVGDDVYVRDNGVSARSV